VESATVEKPPAISKSSLMVSPGLISKIAGWFTLPIKATCGPTGPM
jgi:hypothetical protein